MESVTVEKRTNFDKYRPVLGQHGPEGNPPTSAARRARMGGSNATPSGVGTSGMAEAPRSARAPQQTEKRFQSQRSEARVDTEPHNKTKEKRQFFKKLYHKVVEKKEASRYDTV